MGIQEEIFEVFFKKLEEDEKFPTSIVEKLLRNLKNSGKVVRLHLKRKSLKW